MEARVCLGAEDALTIEMGLPFVQLLVVLESHEDDDEGAWLKHSGLEADAAAAYVRVKLLSISLLFPSKLWPRQWIRNQENKCLY